MPSLTSSVALLVILRLLLRENPGEIRIDMRVGQIWDEPMRTRCFAVKRSFKSLRSAEFMEYSHFLEDDEGGT
ncbi:hypothetical protein ALC53_14246 [Atta colombica]|uniref:Uncharacterized protein n=1 Tax=Atta colombica TaxID=520822 RepID=A0A195ASZ5_9HYME|nr:hypothetical protein ALC53_14246 [Atta colombica]